MPRKKTLPKFRYTTRKNGALFVRYPVQGFKNPIWRKCETETQDEVNRIIGEIKAEHLQLKKESEIPTRSDKFFDFYLNLIKNNVSARTYQARETVVRLYLKPALGYFELREVQPIQFTMIYQKMLDDEKQSLTIRRVHTVAAAIFKEAVNLELLTSNPVSKIRMPKMRTSKKTKVLSEAEAQKFLEACANAPHGIIFEFALETGMRPQEYLALRWSDIDLKKGKVEVVRALVYDRKGGGYEFKEPKTKKSRRTISLSPRMIEKLVDHRNDQKRRLQDLEEKIRARSKPSREHRKVKRREIIDTHKELNLVFPSATGTPFKDINLGKRYFKPLAEQIGLDKTVSMYSLRHTSVSLMLLAGVDIKTIAERVGHSSTSFTMDTYTHLIGNQSEEASTKLAAILYS